MQMNWYITGHWYLIWFSWHDCFLAQLWGKEIFKCKTNMETHLPRIIFIYLKSTPKKSQIRQF